MMGGEGTGATRVYIVGPGAELAGPSAPLVTKQLAWLPATNTELTNSGNVSSPL